MSDTCLRCSHPNGPHVLVATIHFKSADGTKDLPAGGHMFCPEAGCECHRTWSVPDEVAGFDVGKRLSELPPLDRDVIRRVRGH